MNTNTVLPILGTYKVPGHEFVATIPASLLMKMTQDPRRSEDSRAREGDAALAALWEVRKQVQREFAGSAKARNVASYSDYIVRLSEGDPGITPGIVLWTREALESDTTEESLPKLLIPWTQDFVAIDGETQLAARFEAARKSPKTTEMLVDVKICYNRSVEWAKQAFHDLNVLSVRPNTATAISMDMRDPLTHITKEIAELPGWRGNIKATRQLGSKDPGITTFSVLRSAVVCFAEGVKGVARGNRPVAISPEAVVEVSVGAKEFFSALVGGFQANLEARDVITTPAALAAVAAIGHRVLGEPQSARAGMIQGIISNLRGVDWQEGKQWEGIVGRMRENGKFSRVGGVKDSAGAAYKALVDPTSEMYTRVRHLPPAHPQGVSVGA